MATGLGKIPAFAGITIGVEEIPAFAGMTIGVEEIPVFAGMTHEGGTISDCGGISAGDQSRVD